MNDEKEKLGTGPFVIGGLSFIPLLGVFFGVVSIIWGLVTKKQRGKLLAVVGGCGIVFTIIIYGALFYFGFMKRGGIYDDLRSDLAKTTITSLVQSIEFYKVQNGNYPESLEVLRKSLAKNAFVSIYDTTDVKLAGQPRLFYYEIVDSNHYYLLGVGSDGQPFTQDDLIPEVNVGPESKIGLLIKKP